MRPRVFSAPPVHDHTNTYMLSWYKAANVDVVLQGSPGASWGRTVFNPLWIWKHREEFDMYHLQWELRLVRWPLVVSSVLLCRALGKRVLWTVHEVLPHSGERRINSWLTGFFLSRLAERIIVHNRYSAERIRKFFGVSRTIEVVELPDYRIIPIDQKQAKDKLGESRFLYLFFGYFHGYRGANLLIEHFDTKKLQAVLYVQGHFGQPIRKKNIVRIAQNGIIIKAENMSEEMLDMHISAADVIVLPYRVCFTSAAAHRAIQHGKLLVVSKAVARTLDNVNDRIIVYENEKDLPAALEKARQMDTAPLPPKTSINFEQSEYRQRLQKFYR